MAISFAPLFKQLQSIAFLFDSDALQRKLALLNSLQRTQLPSGNKLIPYHETLLFLAAHPSSPQELAMVNHELERIGKHCKRATLKERKGMVNSGLPYTSTQTHFSHDFLLQLMADRDLKIHLQSMDEEELDWNGFFRYTLPAMERSNTTAGYNFNELLDVLKVGEKQKFDFIIDQFKALNEQPFLKDEIFAQLNPVVDVSSAKPDFSRTQNHFRLQQPFFHEGIIKKFDHVELLNTPVPPALNLNEEEKNRAIRTVRYSLALTARETDPCTYMDESSFRLYQLERGISIAFYSMVNQRQLPLESYVGYTLLKNGFPAAYGGAWVFGERAHFGINIFESFRGGESGYVLIQLLRTYRQVFALRYFEVEPYQYGLDNPEGITSGAFWFYYRYGFRPLHKELKQLAAKEALRIKNSPGYRSPEKTLIRFTEANIGLDLQVQQQESILSLSAKISSMMGKEYKGLRSLAITAIQQQFLALTSLSLPSEKDRLAALSDLLLMAKVLNRFEPKDLLLLPAMAAARVTSLYEYQQLLKSWLLQKVKS
jgi:hypothetical protein